MTSPIHTCPDLNIPGSSFKSEGPGASLDAEVAETGHKYGHLEKITTCVFDGGAAQRSKFFLVGELSGREAYEPGTEVGRQVAIVLYVVATT
jgi:hypothetical protein